MISKQNKDNTEGKPKRIQTKQLLKTKKYFSGIFEDEEQTINFT